MPSSQKSVRIIIIVLILPIGIQQKYCYVYVYLKSFLSFEIVAIKVVDNKERYKYKYNHKAAPLGKFVGALLDIIIAADCARLINYCTYTAIKQIAFKMLMRVSIS